MSEPYEELIEGAILKRNPPGVRHEVICDRLHRIVHSSVANFHGTRLLARRTQILLVPGFVLRPDLALITAANGKLWLAVEIVSPDDHRADTVIKKQIYEDLKVPRLWMVDPRYDNVEVYHCGEFGLMLKAILAGQEILSEKLLPEFQLTIAELFRPQPMPFS